MWGFLEPKCDQVVMGGQAWWRHLVLKDWQKSQRDKRNFKGARGRQREQTPTPWGVGLLRARQ